MAVTSNLVGKVKKAWLNKPLKQDKLMPGYKMKNFDIGYQFLPKTGSTSIKRFLYEVETGRRYDEKANKLHVHKWSVKNRQSDISDCQHRFIIIRDPVERLMSAYNNKVVQRSMLSKQSLSTMKGVDQKKIPHFDPSFDTFIIYLDKFRLVSTIDQHTKSIRKLIRKRDLSHYTDVVKFEDLDTFTQRINALTCSKVPLEHHQASHHTTDKRAHVKKASLDKLTEHQLRTIIGMFKDDYALLKHYYTPEAIIEKWRETRA